MSYKHPIDVSTKLSNISFLSNDSILAEMGCLPYS